jgi:uncharacterized protein YggL (DUF469 family)
MKKRLRKKKHKREFQRLTFEVTAYFPMLKAPEVDDSVTDDEVERLFDELSDGFERTGLDLSLGVDTANGRLTGHVFADQRNPTPEDRDMAIEHFLSLGAKVVHVAPMVDLHHEGAHVDPARAGRPLWHLEPDCQDAPPEVMALGPRSDLLDFDCG